MDFPVNAPKRSRHRDNIMNDPENANSSIIGVLLLIVIVLVMGGVVSLMLSSQPLPEKVPVAYLSVSQSHERIELTNKAGDTLTSTSVAIIVDGVDKTKEFRKTENTQDWETLHAGEHIYYDSLQEPQSVNVVFVGNSGQYLLASSGSATVTAPTIIPSPLPVPAIPIVAIPTVLQITPNSGYNYTSINTITINGSAFLSGASIMLNGTGFADIPATEVAVVSPTQMTCSFNLTGLPAGFRNVVVTNSNGNQGMLVGGFRVDQAESRPIADFVATPINGTAPLTVEFNDTSTSFPVSWGWTFGDGGTSTIQNASHQYSTPGNYTVNLTVTNANGTDNEIKTNYIHIAPKNLQANFTSNITQIPVGGFVQFYDTSTNAPTRWQWTFGDDLFYDTRQNPVHQYINPGIFSVHLTVTNSDGSDSETKTEYIQVMGINNPPVFAQIPNQTATIGIPLTFLITASDMDDNRLTYSAVGLPPGAAFDPATRTFAWTPSENMTGNYLVTFRVSDGILTDSKTIKITVNSILKIPPTAQFNANIRQGQTPLTVQFTDQSVSAGLTSYQWDINNDGITDYTTKNPEYTYQKAGTYTVKLTVTNISGSDSEIKTNYITVSSALSGIETFGAESNPTGSPVGGGAGYLPVVTQGTYTVTTASQLVAAAASATTGQTIFIPSSASIDLTGYSTLVVKSGVTLASDRGYNGHAGALIYRKDLTPGGWQNGMITAKSNSRITGLRIQGFQSVYGGDYGDWSDLTTGISVTDQTGVEIDNNEIYYFSYNGVMLRNTASTSNSNWVHHNYIHHVAGMGEGYGIGVCRGTALIEANHFDYVRHAVSGVGYAGESYEARYNLHGTHNIDSNYDVHAADQAGSEWDGSTPSGRLYKIHHNTIPSAVDGYESLYYVSPPTEGMYVYNNILGRSITAHGGTARLSMTNNYIGGVLHASGQ